MTLLITRGVATFIMVSMVSAVTTMASVDTHDHNSHYQNADKSQVENRAKKNDSHNYKREHGDLHSEAHDDHDDHDRHEDHDDHDDHENEDIPLHLDDKAVSEFGIKIETAKRGWIKKKALFPGEVTLHLDHLARVTPRFPGVVKHIYSHIGDEVNKGDRLAVIESNDSLTPYNMTAPISGTLIEKYLTLGESVEENSHAFKIANLETVWVTFSIFQDKVGEISKGQKAIIQSSNGKYKTQGTISYVSPIVDPHTRTQMGRIAISNTPHDWKPGMFVDVEVVFSTIKGSVVVPRTAVHKMANKPFIFVKDGDDFDPHPVQLGAFDANQVIVTSGLTPRARYVADGGFILKAELEKGAMGHGHSH